MSVNAAKRLGSPAAFDELLQGVSECQPDWAVIYVSECDGLFHQGDACYIWPHSVFRHWPGPGSMPMLMIVNSWARPFLKATMTEGRAMLAQFCDYCSINVSLIGLHGGHDDALPLSLADAAFLAKRRRRGSHAVFIGDFNVDQLPTMASDPWAEISNRENHHAWERAVLDEFAEAMHVGIVLPERSEGVPVSRFAEQALHTTVTRVPIGGQKGLPSLLDFCLLGEGCSGTSWLSWDVASGDHAAMFLELQCPFKVLPRWRQTHWHPSRLGHCAAWIEQNAPSDFQTTKEFHGFARKAQDNFKDNGTAKERRSRREPEHIKALRAEINGTAVANEKAVLRERLYVARKVWLEGMRQQRIRDGFEKGRPHFRAKKLLPLSKMVREVGQSPDSIDRNNWAAWVQEAFRLKWGDRDLHRRSIINDELARGEGLGLDISEPLLSLACKKLRRPKKLDHYGVSTAVISIIVKHAAGATVRFFTRMAASTSTMAELEVHGRVAAKTKGCIPPSKCRAILPLPSVLGILDVLLNGAMSATVDRVARQCGPAYLECAKKGRQILDITFPLSQIIEKGLDDNSMAAIAQSDVKQFYDFIRPLDIFRWFVQKGGFIGAAYTFLRLHSVVQVALHAGSAIARIEGRCVGVLTGTRSAGTAGRIPILDCAMARLPAWVHRCYRIPGHAFALASFVDNLFATGFDAESAISILDDAEQYLGEKWRLKIGQDSKIVLPARGCERPSVPGWPVADEMKCLGQILSNNGSISGDFDGAVRQMWGSFFGNLQPGLLDASQKARMRFLASCVKPVAGFRWTRWPYQKAYACRLDAVQTGMISRLEHVRPRRGEQPLDFFVRRARRCSQLATTYGRWSASWRRQVCTWHAHLERAHDEGTWGHKLRHYHDESWLLERRAEAARQYSCMSRLNIRAICGRPTKRWSEGLSTARAEYPLAA